MSPIRTHRIRASRIFRPAREREPLSERCPVGKGDAGYPQPAVGYTLDDRRPRPHGGPAGREPGSRRPGAGNSRETGGRAGVAYSHEGRDPNPVGD